MKTLFEDLSVGFFAPEKRSFKQEYMDHLADLIIKGRGLMNNPDDESPEPFIERDLTEEEIEELYYKLGYWLNSLN